MIRRAVNLTYKTAKRIVIAVVGSSVLLIGMVMIVTPGPAFVVIPIGLAILAVEFVWARRWLTKLREMISRKSAEQRTSRVDDYRK